MIERSLDLDAVEAFVRIAELGSFTRAAEAMSTAQAAISLKLKRLEDRLGCRLIERTPRHVQLSARGAAFLEHARELLAAHDRALATFAQERQRLTIGISDHVAGPELPALIARMNQQDPQLLIEIRIGSSGDLLQSYDRRGLDAVLARMHGGRLPGRGAGIAHKPVRLLMDPAFHSSLAPCDAPCRVSRSYCFSRSACSRSRRWPSALAWRSSVAQSGAAGRAAMPWSIACAASRPNCTWPSSWCDKARRYRSKTACWAGVPLRNSGNCTSVRSRVVTSVMAQRPDASRHQRKVQRTFQRV